MALGRVVARCAQWTRSPTTSYMYDALFIQDVYVRILCAAYIAQIGALRGPHHSRGGGG